VEVLKLFARIFMVWLLLQLLNIFLEGYEFHRSL